MNKILELPDLNIVMASLAIAIKTDPTTPTQVLGRLIHYSEDGIITHPIPIGTTIRQELGISNDAYRQAMVKLTQLGLISRQNQMITLDMLVKTPFSAIHIRESKKVKKT